MRDDDWLPVSAAALVAGAMALLLATVLTTDGATTQDMFRTVQEQGGRLLGGAFIYFLASVGLILGLPAIMVLVRGRRGERWQGLPRNGRPCHAADLPSGAGSHRGAHGCAA